MFIGCFPLIGTGEGGGGVGGGGGGRGNSARRKGEKRDERQGSEAERRRCSMHFCPLIMSREIKERLTRLSCYQLQLSLTLPSLSN